MSTIPKKHIFADHSVNKGTPDISQQDETIAALKERNRIWQNTFDAMHEAISILDHDFRILQCNRAMLKFADRPASEIIGHHCWEIVHGTDGPIDNCPCFRVSRSHRRESVTLTIDDRIIQVDVDPQLDEQGRPTRFTHIISDITEQNRAIETIRETHQTLLTVLDSIDAAIYVSDMHDHRILFMNQHMKEIFKGDFRGQKCWQAFYNNQDGPCIECTNAELMDKNGDPTGSCIFEGQNPVNRRWYINYSRAIKWVDGRYVHLQVSTDITDIKNMEKQRLMTEARLRQAQKMEAIGTLAGGIAHDFNNILSAILGYSELALDDAMEGVPSANYIRQIINAGYRARDLVQQILTFSRQTETEAKPIQVKPIVKEALKLLRASLPTTIDIRSQLDSQGIVEADPTQIHQIIMNLCTNAGHAMRSSGGILSVGLKNVTLEREFTRHHAGMRPGPHISLEVGDTGEGIDASILERIFDPYFTTKIKGEGTGIGLAMVQGIVQNMNGTAMVESRKGEGSRFTILLPVITYEAKAVSMADTIIPGGHERILFVDDEPALANLGKQLLERLGYRVTVCTSSTEALSVFNAGPQAFDLVITDMTMPHLTGDALAQSMLASRPDIPIVICTGYSERITEDMIERLKIKALIMKPLVRAEMALAVRQALDDQSDGR